MSCDLSAPVVCTRMIYKITKKDGSLHHVQLDKEQVLPGKLYINGNGYVNFWDPCTHKDQLLHRWMLLDPHKLMIDHINGDKLDNRRCNLRMANNTENQWNKLQKSSLGVRGVYKQPGGRYNAKIRAHRKLHSLGSFATLEGAIAARDAFELACVPFKSLYLRK